VAALKAYKLGHNEEMLRLGELWEDQNLVFPNSVGKPINPSNFYHREVNSPDLYADHHTLRLSLSGLT
jgi:hypothetical protein